MIKPCIMKNARFVLKPLAAIFGGLLISFAMTSCDRTRNDKGYEYFPDMVHSQAFETYSQNPNYPDGATNQMSAPGTIPREHIPFNSASNIEGRIQAGQEVFNPIVVSPEVVARGKEQYLVYCQMCHGEKGDGQGYLFTNKLYTFQPASLVNDKARNLPDGEIYHTITLGFGVMGAHGAQISRDDRWKIIHYIREELQK